MEITLKSIAVIFIFFLVGCGQDKDYNSEIKSLSAAEQHLCDSLKFNPQLVDIIKVHTGQPISLIPKINENAEIMDSSGFGLSSKYAIAKARPFVLAYKDEFRKESCLLFIFSNHNTGLDYIGLIHGRNDLDILKWRKTKGSDQGHSNEDLVNKFSGWKQSEDFYIVAVGENSVEIEFKSPVRNAEKFAADAYAFCPGLIEDDSHITDLILKLKNENALTFTWD